MSPKTFIRRKFRSRWSDLQLLVLLELADGGLVSMVELIERTGASQTGVWNALHRNQMEDHWEILKIERIEYYGLTESGMAILAKILER